MIFKSIFGFIGELAAAWGNLFSAPFINFDMLWIIIPVYLNWFFAEYFQEKKGTSLGNAISNGTIALWVGADWARTNLRLRAEQYLPFDAIFFSKLFLAILMLAYGVFVIVQGIRARKFIHFMGRIRVVTYLILVFTPLFYGVILPEDYLICLLAIIVFFPVFYFTVELIDKLTPDNAAIKEADTFSVSISEINNPGNKDYNYAYRPEFRRRI